MQSASECPQDMWNSGCLLMLRNCCKLKNYSRITFHFASRGCMKGFPGLFSLCGESRKMLITRATIYDESRQSAICILAPPSEFARRTKGGRSLQKLGTLRYSVSLEIDLELLIEIKFSKQRVKPEHSFPNLSSLPSNYKSCFRSSCSKA